METRADLMQASRAFWESRALLSAVEVGLFEALGAGRATSGAAAKRIGADRRATEMLLDALVGLGVLGKREGRYQVRRALKPFLLDGPASCLAMLRHHARLWKSWDRLTECVRRGDAVARKSGFRGSPDDARDFTHAMRDGARRFAPDVAEEVPLGRRRRLLDLGGGPGVYAAAFARRNPSLEVVIVDLPAVCAAGEALRGEAADVASRIRYHAADLDEERLPDGADAAFLSHVIHGQRPAEIRALFRRVRRALPPGGLFVVRDFFTSPDHTQPPSASLFALNMLVNTPGGRTYSAEEVSGWLVRAGFPAVTFRRSKVAPDSGYLFARIPKRPVRSKVVSRGGGSRRS